MEDTEIHVVCFTDGVVRVLVTSFLPYEERGRSVCFLKMRVPPATDLTQISEMAQEIFREFLNHNIDMQGLAQELRNSLKVFGTIGSVEYRISRVVNEP